MHCFFFQIPVPDGLPVLARPDDACSKNGKNGERPSGRPFRTQFDAGFELDLTSAFVYRASLPKKKHSLQKLFCSSKVEFKVESTVESRVESEVESKVASRVESKVESKVKSTAESFAKSQWGCSIK